MKRAIGLLMVAFLAGCAGTVQENIEEARFLLDKARYSEAEVKARAALAADPGNIEATFFLGSALLGKAVLGEGKRLLDRFADILESQAGAGTTELETFRAITPETTTGLPDLREATDIFDDLRLNSGVPSGRLTDVYLRLYLCRLFEIAGVLRVIGAQDEDKDGNADALDVLALDAAGAARLLANVHGLSAAGDGAKLPDNYGLTDRVGQIGADMDTAIANAPGQDVTLGVQAFLTVAFM